MASLNTHETQKGLRVKFRDVECFRDFVVENSYNYDEYNSLDVPDVPETFNVWKPLNETVAKKEKSNLKPSSNAVADIDSDDYAVLLGIRAQQNTGANDMEELDLSTLDTNDDALPHTDVVQNITRLGFESDGKNLTKNAVQNESTTKLFIKSSLESTASSSIINGSNSITSITTNASNISIQENITSKITSENRHDTFLVTEEIRPLLSTQTSRTHTENVTVAQSLESVVVVDDDDRSKDDIFIYSVPAINSHISMTDVTDVKEDFVLFGNGQQTNSHERVVENGISPTELPNSTILELLGNTTQTTWLEDAQELNHTNMNTESLYEMSQESNNPIVVIQELNSTQGEYEFPVKEHKDLNNNQVDFGFLVKEDEELNHTEVKSKSVVKKNKELNYTQVDSEFLVKEDKELNSTQLDFRFFVMKDEELNQTEVDSESKFKEDREFNHTQMDSVQDDIKHMNTEITLEDIRDLPSTQDHLYSDVQQPNSSNLDSRISSNTMYDSNKFFGNESTERPKLPQNVTLFATVPFIDKAHNKTLSNLWTSLKELSSDRHKNTSFSNETFNLSSTESNSSHTNILLISNNSSEQITPDIEKSFNEVVIYLKDSNNTMAILTEPLDTQAKNWSYDGKHELVPMEFPDHMNIYITDKQPNSAKEEKKKVHLQRVTPMKGYGMKTKKRKEYKPQVRSDISPRGFSPRGFVPSQLTPRTTKPNFSEEDMVPKAIVIGIPRNDFNDYEIYVPHDKHDFDFENSSDNLEEYEYVEYKDPYGKPSQTETDVLDEVTKYSLQMAGSKSRVYFITAEEVNWDYAGYGQR